MKKSLLVVALVVIGGCASNSNDDLHNRIASIKAKPAGKIPPLPTFPPYETFLYAARNEQDPFKGFESDTAMQDSTQLQVVGSPLQMQGREGGNLEALEEYPLDTLRYVGQLTKDGQEWAIVTSPDNIVHRVKEGNHLGTNYGEIVEIIEDKMIIEEIIPDEIGGWTKRDAALSLME